MKKLGYLLLVCCSLLLMSGCGAHQRLGTGQMTLIVGLDDSFVPMGFQTPGGRLSGFDIDLAQAAGKVMKRKIVFQTIDWSMKETELRNGTIDLIWNGYTKTPERQKKVAFSQTYLQNRQVMVVPRSLKITRLKQLQNKTVGVQSASTGYFDVMQEPKVLKDFIKDQRPVQYDNIQQGMLDLQSGRIQGFLIDGVFARYYLKQGHLNNKYRVITSPFPPDKFAVGINRHNLALQRQVREALDQLKRSGELQKIQQKWFGTTMAQ